MGTYLLRRLGTAVVVLWAAYSVSFVVLYLLPGDPVTTMARGGLDGEPLRPEEIEALKARYGLDKPLIVQYGLRLGAVLRGDLGTSVQTGQDVRSAIREALGPTHDLGVAADRADRIVVMSGGPIVEAGPTRQVLTAPAAPYTRALLAAAPGLARAASRAVAVSPADGPRPLVEVRNLVKEFRLPRVAGRRSVLRAVDDVSFTIGRGETLGLVGESGSGKSTVARLVLRLADPTAGEVAFDGVDITRTRGSAWRELRRRAQLVYQNPYASLDPRFTVEEVVTEPLRAFSVGDAGQRRRRAAHLVERVALPSGVLARRPAELSGGQRQRIGIARALALSPDLVVCDEPVSALDVSVQAQVLALLQELQDADGLAYLFISHDLAVVRRLAHRVGVMREGRLLELRPTEEPFTEPREDYTRELLAAIAGQRRSGLGTIGPPVDPGAAPVKESA